MTRFPIHFLLRMGSSAMFCLAATCVSAQPRQPLQLIVGFPAGGTVDILTRQIAEGLRGRLNRPVVIESRPGAGGIIATEHVRNSPPDGNTLLVSPTTEFTLYPLTMHKLPYKPSDFTPVVHIACFEYALGVESSVPARNVAEYVSLVKSDNKYGMYGAPGVVGPPQFYGRIFASRFGLKMTTIPYPGTPPLMLALESGQIPAAVLPLGEMAKLVHNGKARLIATTGEKRSKNFPNVPTFAESGVPITEDGQYAIYAPTGTPAALLEPIAKAVREVLQTPPVKALYSNMYVEATGQTGAALQKTIADSMAFWGEAVRANPDLAKDGGK